MVIGSRCFQKRLRVGLLFVFKAGELRTRSPRILERETVADCAPHALPLAPWPAWRFLSLSYTSTPESLILDLGEPIQLSDFVYWHDLF